MKTKQDIQELDTSFEYLVSLYEMRLRKRKLCIFYVNILGLIHLIIHRPSTLFNLKQHYKS